MPFPSNMDATWMEGAVSFNAQELRRADTALAAGDGNGPLSPQGGIVRHNDNSLAVTVSVADVVTVQPGAVVIPGNSGTGNGIYRSALAVAETGNLAARSATLPRIDLVVYRAMDTSVVAGHGAYTGRIEIIAGTPAASPVAPALPALAVELARITVPISGGAAASVDSSFRTFFASPGGDLLVPTFARLPASPNPKWVKAVALDTGIEYIWNGTSWRRTDLVVGKALLPVVNTNTWSNPTTAVFPDAATRTALTSSFTKAQASTLVEVHMAGSMYLTSGVEQNIPIYMNFGGNNQLICNTRTNGAAGVRFYFSGHVLLPNIAAGTYNIEPTISASAAVLNMYASGDSISYTVREVTA
jgi:hypothetical protein